MNIKIYKILFIVMFFITIVSCKSLDSNLNMIEGKFVDESAYPTVVLLYDFNYDSKYNYFVCTGVVVSENVVLTSAHCLVDLIENKASSTFSYKIVGRGIMINGVMVGGATPVIIPEFEKDLIQDYRIEALKAKVEEDYIVSRSISRSEYEEKVLSLKKQFSNYPYNIGALVFKNRSPNHPPFRFLIEEAKQQGTFFTLSKNTFDDGIIINDNKRSLFFLGYGVSGNYEDLNNLEKKEEETTGQLQLGHNLVKYSKSRNEWYTPKPIEKKVSKVLYNKSNVVQGDYGGPLIYNNQIIGISSYGALYDCEGNDIYLDPVSDKYMGIDSNGNKLNKEECLIDPYCSKIFYVNSHFISTTLGSSQKIPETLFKKIKEELINEKLLENNSIFSELSE